MTTIFQNWLDENSYPEIKVVESDEFSYNVVTDTIKVTTELSYQYLTVLEYAKELGLRYNPGPWVLAFFHEVGHSETLLDDSLDEYWEAYFDRQDIMTISDYVRHPIESAATEWAVNYINENTEEVKQMVKDIDAAMGSRVAEMSEEEMIKAFVRSE